MILNLHHQIQLLNTERSYIYIVASFRNLFPVSKSICIRALKYRDNTTEIAEIVYIQPAIALAPAEPGLWKFQELCDSRLDNPTIDQ
jgi:hypothetical protein